MEKSFEADIENSETKKPTLQKKTLADIPKVMQDLIFELEWLGAQGNDDLQRALLPFNEWLIETVLPAYQLKFVQQYI